MSGFLRIRTLFRLLFYGLIGLVLILVTSVWWLPLALPTVLRQFDVRVESVERLNSGRLLLAGVGYASDSVSADFGAVELPSLHRYMWERFGGGFTEASLVGVASLELRLRGAESETTVDAVSVHGQARAALALYGRWLPPVELGELSLSPVAAEGALVVVRDLSLRDWDLLATVAALGLPESVSVEATLDPAAAWAVRLRAPDAGLLAELELHAVDDTGLSLAARLTRGGEVVEGAAFFAKGQRLPVSATLESVGFSLDSSWLPGAKDLPVEAVRLSKLNLHWDAGRYEGSVQLTADFLREERVPFNAVVALSGDLETLRVDACELVAGWGRLVLSEPLEVRLSNWSVVGNAELQARLDLAEQPFVKARGRVEASLSVAPSLEAGPNVSFELSAVDVGYAAFSAETVQVAGRLRGSELSIEQLRVQPVGGSGAEGIDLSGVADVAARTLDFSYVIAGGADWINARIGQAHVSHALKSEGRVSGSWDRPVVEGAVASLELELPRFEPMAFAGSFRTEGFDRAAVSGALTCRGAVIEAAVDVSMVEGLLAVDFNKFVWTDPERPTLELAAPTRLSFRTTAAAEAWESRIAVEAFHLAGPELDVRGRWDAASGLELALRNVTLARMGRWVEGELPPYAIEAVELSLSQLRPQLIGSVGLRVESRIVGEAPLRVELAARLDRSGVVAERIQIDFSGEPLLRGAIALPVRFQLPVGGALFWELLDDGALEGALSGSANAAFTAWLTRMTGVRMESAALDLQVKGSLRQPVGGLNLRVTALDAAVEGVPVIDLLEIEAKAEPDAIRVERFGLSLNQSEMSGELMLPLQALVDAVRGDVASRRALLSRSSGRIELVEWRAENWVDFLPAMMRRSGVLSGELDLKPNWELSGTLNFEDFALRPTQSLPLVDQIGGELELSKRVLKINNASARVGGSPVAFTGWLDAHDAKDPLWVFNATGKNVPLARTTDMILRSDLDLQASHEDRSATPVVSGVLNLRSSALLVEFDPLAPKVESGRGARPPYFSIDEPVIADWRFDLSIAGDSFMRVRSPYFRAKLSADFELGGTFVQPLLIGTVRTVEGELRFPGAKMRVDSGEAYIEPGRPDAVLLNFTGIAQKADYVITMDVSQSLDNPQIQFQSTPALTNAAIMRLLATGSTTGGGVGSVGLYLGQGLLGAGGVDEQLSDRLTVDVGEQTSRSGRSTVGVRYDVSDEVYLKGEYDEFDAYNLDLIWSILKR